MSLLYAVHDEEGASLVPTGGWNLCLVELSKSPPAKSYDSRLNNILRLNWGYGTTGTIPLESEDGAYFKSLSTFLAGLQGTTRFIVGNEPNHPQEWPQGKPILVDRYVSFFKGVRQLIRQVNPAYQVFPAAIAPYRAGWLDYWKGMLGLIAAQGGCEGLAIHAYTRSANPSDIIDPGLRMKDAPLTGTFSGFLTYQDALLAVPAPLQQLPAHITEFTELLPGGWVDKNTGVIKAAYEEINRWNQDSSPTKIHSLHIYRYPNYDSQGFVDKPSVQKDFAEATQKAFLSPDNQSGVFIPIVGTGDPVPPLNPATDDVVQEDQDAESKLRGVTMDELSGGLGWYVTKIDWLDEKESQGRHHIYYDILDESGKRLVDVHIRVVWSTGATTVVSELKAGEPYAANFAMSPSRNDYTTWIISDLPSEKVKGLGMGADTPSGFNPGAHTSTFIIFQRLNPVSNTLPPTQDAPPPERVQLIPPLQLNSYLDTISQKFASTEIDYSQFGLKGHNGIDFAVPTGTPVYAAADGVVQEVGYDKTGYGNYIKLRHSWGETLYAHLLKSLVQQGMHVSAGEEIGISNASGNATGPHLHFGLRRNPYNRSDGYDGYSDPLPYLTPFLGLPSADLTGIFKQVARESGLNWRLLASQAWAESSFRAEIPDGLLQVGDAVWSDWAQKVSAKDKNNPLDNTRVAAAYLHWLLERYRGDERKALTAYNWGPGNVDGGLPAPGATQTYVEKVIHGRDLLQALGV